MLRRAPARVGAADHRGHPVLRLCPPGPQGAPRTPITSKLVADLIPAAGATASLSVDLHAGQIQGFFNIPFDHLYAMPVMLEDYLKKLDLRPGLVSPDAGGVERARAYSKRLNASLAIIDKRRERANVTEVMHLIGDVKGKDVHHRRRHDRHRRHPDRRRAHALRREGRARVVACATHAVLSGPAIQRIVESPLDEVVVTDTIPLTPTAAGCGPVSARSPARRSSPRRSSASTTRSRCRPASCRANSSRPSTAR